MSRPILTWLLLLLLVLAGTTSVRADGCFIPPRLQGATKPSSAAQKAVMLAEGQDEVLLLQTTYHGPADHFAWVVPVPSKPSEIFAAEPAFLTETFRGTEPVVVTKLAEPKLSRRYKSADTAAAPSPPSVPAGGAPAPPPVQVLDEREVGDYHAVVLAATQSGALQKWLDRNDYRLPAEAEPVLSGYVQRGWVFVALKMQEQRAREQAVLREVAPLGLRFRCPVEGLVYPLTISRVSAPPLSAILLCVIAQRPYTCTTLPTVWLTQKVKLKHDETYGNLRRRMTRNPTRLLCEFSGNPPFQYTGLGYRARDWETGRSDDGHLRRASRFFGLLEPAEMTDLTFTPDAEPQHADYRVLVQRRGPAIPHETMEFLTRMEPLKPGSREQHAALGKPATLPRLKPEPDPHRGPVGDQWRVVLAVFIAVVALLVWLLRRCPPTAVLLLLGGLLPLALAAGVARGGGVMPGLSALVQVQAAMDLFQGDTGCLPATVADLAARQAPKVGLDASGNPAPVHGWRGPYLMHIPPDPIRGGHLIVDPLNAFAVDSTGLATTCWPATYAEAALAAGGRSPEARPYWNATPREAVERMGPYQQWLRARRGHHLFAFETGVNSGRAEAITALVVDRDDLTYFALRGKPCRVATNGQVLTWHVARQGVSSSYMPGPTDMFCGVTSATHAFSLLPRVGDTQKVLALRADGAALIYGEGHLTVLKLDGTRRDYAWTGDAIWQASFSRDGRTVYVVSRRGDGQSYTAISRLDLATGKVTVADQHAEERFWAPAPDGVLYVRGQSLWYVADGLPRRLATPPDWPVALALTREYAYWAVPTDETPQTNLIYRISLSGGQATPIARAGRDPLVMAADGKDVYTVHCRHYDHIEALTLLADGRKPIRLDQRQGGAAPADLPYLN